MGVIELNIGNCHNCYKCIRECPVKAIAFQDGKATIIDDECILCGNCVQCCPQNAKFIKSDHHRVQELIAQGKRVYATVAPSWPGFFGTDDFGKLSAALKKLGFAGVEETAIGANETSREYAALMENGQMKNIIATACASVVMMVERYYPELIKNLAPVSSPMMAHAKLMRETYGDIKVAFIGPCLSKKNEAADPLAGGLVNFALTFGGIQKWMDAENVRLDKQDAEAAGVSNPVSRLYPKTTGILKTIPEEKFGRYRPVAVDGVDRCMEMFDAIRDGKVEGLFVEANICPGGCIGGPVMRMGQRSVIVTETMLDDDPMPQDERPAPTSLIEFPHPRVFTNRSVEREVPTEEQIRAILSKIGKLTPEDELNCGSCGYHSCREKAVAVFQGKADINMCLPFFRERAENISSTVTEYSPNAIIALDEELNVQDLNPMAEDIYQISRAEMIGFPIPAFYGELDFDTAKREERAVTKKVHVDESDKTVEQTILYIREHGMYLVFVKDITDEEQHKQHLESLRDSTVDIAQNVIVKQMRVAQEIASLLGETTAETKVALTNLKKSMTELSEL